MTGPAGTTRATPPLRVLLGHVLRRHRTAQSVLRSSTTAREARVVALSAHQRLAGASAAPGGRVRLRAA